MHNAAVPFADFTFRDLGEPGPFLEGFVAIILAIATVIYARRAVLRPRLRYGAVSITDMSLIESPTRSESRLYDDETSSNPEFLVEVALANVGRRDISSADFQGPIEIYFGSDVSIVQVKNHAPAINRQLGIRVVDDHVEVGPGLLVKGASANVKVVVASSPNISFYVPLVNIVHAQTEPLGPRALALVSTFAKWSVALATAALVGCVVYLVAQNTPKTVIVHDGPRYDLSPPSTSLPPLPVPSVTGKLLTSALRELAASETYVVDVQIVPASAAMKARVISQISLTKYNGHAAVRLVIGGPLT